MLALTSDGVTKKFVWVFDLGHLIGKAPSIIDSNSQVVIVNYGGQAIGLLVAELHDVPEFNLLQIMPGPFSGQGEGAMISRIIKANEGEVLIRVLDVDYLFSLLMRQKKQPDLQLIA